MKLSVILASYNENQYLDEAITSCLEQSFKDFEIIIGDDGSDDGSLDTIKSYANKYSNISYFVMDRSDIKDLIPSIRVSNLIKRAISQANGEYIICLSGDDYFVGNNVFTTHIANLDKDVNHKYSASVANYTKVWSDGKKQVINARRLPSRNYWATDYLHLSCFMFRKEIYGPAFIEAYKLENQIAIYPRIILSRKLQEKVINSNTPEILDLIRQDSSDLNYYINFIGQINEFNNDDGCFWEYQEFLRKIKRIINDGLANEDPHIRQKYLWLSSYYYNEKKLNISEL